MDWISAIQGYEPHVEQASEANKAFKEFETSLLSEDTAVRRSCFALESQEYESSILDEAQLDIALNSELEAKHYEFLFINRRLKQKSQRSTNTHKLHISSDSFQTLATKRNLPAAFISAICRHYLPAGRGLRATDTGVYTAWHLLPLRVQVLAKKPLSAATSSTTSDNQMNPFHYLRLPDANVEIRGACIAIFSSHCPARRSSKFVVVNFLSGAWPKIVEEPRMRIEEAISHSSKPGECGDGGFVYLVFLSNIARWWTNALNSVNEQLISYEKHLQEEMDRDEAPPTAFYTRINRALHTVAAHLHRYCSELKSLEETIISLRCHQDSLTGCIEELQGSRGERIIRGYEQVLSQIKASTYLATELEKKSTNILALLFNGMHITSDRQALENGRRMQKILEVTQDETRIAGEMAKQNQLLAEDMKNDSVAMKTIAIVTMFFLPGATFATLLSMPFFSENVWMKDASRVWLWFAFTVPTTISAFLFYLYHRKRRSGTWTTTKKFNDDNDDNDDMELGNLGGAQDNTTHIP